jgi:hypothetical protein
MKRELFEEVQRIHGNISLVIDESTTMRVETGLIIYLKCEFDKNREPESFFFELVKVSDQSAETISNTLLASLAEYGFDDAYLKKYLIAIATDGASAMIGSKSGVITILSKKYPNIILWHCLNHRLELGVNDAIKVFNLNLSINLFPYLVLFSIHLFNLN